MRIGIVLGLVAAAFLTGPMAWAATLSPATVQEADHVAKERARLDLLSQKRFVLVQTYLSNARQLEERLDFEGAERELEKARELDPVNRLVLDYLRQIRALLGKADGGAAALRMSAAERYEAQLQQIRLQAQQDLTDCQQALAHGDYDLAVLLARGVVHQVDWSNADIDWGDLAPRSRMLLRRAERQATDARDDLNRKKEAEAYSKLQEDEQRATEQQQARIDALLRTGTDLYLHNDFAGAQSMAEAILAEDRHHSRALELREVARDAERENGTQQFREARREEFMKWRQSMESVRIPHTGIMTGPDPDRWAEITARRAGPAAVGLTGPDADTQALRARLASETMDADFDELTIVQVANNIFLSTGISVSVDPEVVDELDSNAEYVTLRDLRSLPVSSLLNILVDHVGEDLAWTIRNGRVYLTKQEKAAGEPVVRVHNIQDVTFAVQSFKGPNLKGIPLPGEAGDDVETSIFNTELGETRLIEPDEIENLIRENIARESWDSVDAYSLAPLDNENLLVIHTPEVQEQVAAFLDGLRTFSTSMVTLESRFIAITDAFIEEVGTDLRGLGPGGKLGDEEILEDVTDPDASQGQDNSGSGSGPPSAGVFFDDVDQFYGLASEFFFTNPLGNLLSTVGGGAFQFTILDDTQVNIVMRMVQKSRNAFQVTAPMVSVFNTQRAFVSVVNQVSYIQGFDVDVANAARIADPIIGVVQEGIVLDVRPTISYDRRYITLDVQTTVADLVGFESFETNLGSDFQASAVKFQLPQLDTQDARTTVVIPDGGSVILGGFKNVLYKNRTAEAPWLADIPVLGFFFREKGLADEMEDLIIVIRATVTDFSALRDQPVVRR